MGVDCTGCGFGNVEGARFCIECGTALARSCPGCGHSVVPTAKFCDQCGTSLEAPAAAPANAPTASRKQVTALFADLVGSTSFGETVDAEVARTALADYFDLLRASVEAHAGTVEKFTGDGVMAVFGLPEMAEDDALRAVAAGREMQRRFVSFADRVRERYGVELALRVGINSGELVVGDADADLVGDVLNTAARLEAACAPGGVLVGEDTWRLTRASVAYEIGDQVSAKGKAEPLATFVVADGAAPDEQSPFVGRAEEFDTLRDVLADVAASDRARLATIVGDPGVGKTRLAAELRAAADVRSYDLRLERRGGTTFGPIVELLRDVLGTVDRNSVAALLVDHPDGERLADLLVSLAGQGTARSTEESFWAVRRLLEVLAGGDPLLVVVDDIQWAEPLFWDLLDHLAEWVEAPVLLLALARPELRELRPELAVPGRRVAAAVALEGLDRAATLQLAAKLLSVDRLPHELVERLPESTQGNPLFVRELVRSLVEDGVLEPTDDGWRLTVDVESIEVPATVISLLASRVERLPPDERDALELASVIGTDFDRGSLAALSDGEAGAALGAVLDRLRRKDLIEASGTWVGDQPVYRFHHVLLRDAAYRRVLKARRAALHERLGRHLETSAGRAAVGVDEVDVVVAHHYEAAHTFRAELGADDEVLAPLADAAAGRLADAAERALERDDLPAAGGYAERALRLERPGPKRDQLLVLGCEALLSSGDAVGAAPLVDELEQSRATPELAAWADCFRAQQWTLSDSERLVDANELSADAANRLADLGDAAGVAKARLVRATTLARLGRVGECEAELDAALTSARDAGDRRRVASVLGVTPLAALWGPSPAARAGGRCLDVLRLLHITTASPAVEATSFRCQGVLEALRGRLDSARSKLESSRSTARELGLEQSLMETELFAGMVELSAGELEAAEQHLRIAHEGLGTLQIGADAGQAGALLAMVLIERGDLDEAEVLAESAVEAAGQNRRTSIAGSAALARVRAAQGRLDEASALAGTALERAASTDTVLDHVLALGTAAAVARVAGDSVAADGHLRDARTLLEQKGSIRWIGADVERDDLDGGQAERAPVPETGPGDENGLDEAFGELDWVPPNAAARLFEQTSDRSKWSEIFDPSAVVELRSPIALGEVTLEESAAQIDWITDRSAITRSLFATRGDDAALFHDDVEAEPGSFERWLVVHRGESGRIASAASFDGGDLAAAMEELDRGVGSERRAFSDGMARGLRDADAGAVRNLLADDCVCVDHRPVGFGELDAAGFAAILAARAPGGSLLLLERRFSDDDRVAFDQYLITDPAGLEWRSFTVSILGGDGICRMDFFGVDQRVEAEQLFDDLAADTDDPALPWPNDAWRAFDRAFGDFVKTGDTEAFAARFTPDAEIELRSPVAIGRISVEEIAAQAAGFRDMPDAHATRELIATRGPRTCLVRSQFHRSGEVSDRLQVIQISEDGRVARQVSFDGEELDEAVAELNRRSVPQGYGDRVSHHDRWVEILRTSDRELARSFVSDDVVCVDHRPNGVGQLGADAFADFQAARPPGVRGLAVELRWNDDLSVLLGRWQHEAPWGDEWRLFTIASFENDRASRIELFADDQREFAERRFREMVSTDRNIEPQPNTAWRHVDLTHPAPGDDAESARARLRRAFVAEPAIEFRSPIRLGRVGLDEFLSQVGGLRRTGDPGTSSRRRLAATRGDRLCLARFDFGGGDDVSERLVVFEVSDEPLITAMISFDAKDHDAAFAELDRRWAEDGVSNRASRRAEESMSVLLSETLPPGVRWDRFWEPDGRVIERRRSAPYAEGGREHVESNEQYLRNAVADFGVTAIDVEVLAVRDDDLALVRQTFRSDAGRILDWLMLVELGETGRIARAMAFDADERVAAFAELEVAWARRDGPPEWTSFLERVHRAGDFDARRFLAPSIRVVNHRRFSKGDFDFDSAVAANAFMRNQGATSRPRQFLEQEGPVALIRVLRRFDDGSEMEAIILFAHDGERFTDLEEFDLDDVEAARARFREFVAEREAHVPSSTSPVIDVIRRITAAMVAGDAEARDALVHPDFVWRERRRYAPKGEYGWGRELHENLAFFSERLAKFSVEQIAARGDHLAMYRMDNQLDDFTELETWIAVSRITDDGRVLESTYFDEDQFDEAVDLLDTTWRETDGPPFWSVPDRGIMRILDESLRSEAYVPGAMLIDHRPSGFGTIPAIHFAESLSVIEIDRYFVPEACWSAENSVVLFRMRTVGVDENEWEEWHLHTFDGDRVTGSEMWAVVDEAAARTRFEEIVAERRAASTVPDITNAAVEIGHETIGKSLDDDLTFEAFADWFEPGAVIEERGRSNPHVDLDVEGMWDNLQFMRSLGLGRVDVDTIAIRGDRLVLSRLTTHGADGSAGDGTIGEALGLLETSECGRIARITHFQPDQLDEAIEALNIRWRDTDGPAWWGHDGRGTRRAMDPALRATAFTPDALMFDHRPSGFGTISANEWACSLDMVGDFEVRVPQVRWSDEHQVVLMHITTINPDDEMWDEWHLYTLDGDIPTSGEMWVVEDVDCARARFEELTS